MDNSSLSVRSSQSTNSDDWNVKGLPGTPPEPSSSSNSDGWQNVASDSSNLDSEIAPFVHLADQLISHSTSSNSVSNNATKVVLDQNLINESIIGSPSDQAIRQQNGIEVEENDSIRERIRFDLLDRAEREVKEFLHNAKIGEEKLATKQRSNAIALYELAARSEYRKIAGSAAISLYKIFRNRDGRYILEGDTKQATQWLFEAANKGDPRALRYLGYEYDEGNYCFATEDNVKAGEHLLDALDTSSKEKAKGNNGDRRAILSKRQHTECCHRLLRLLNSAQLRDQWSMPQLVEAGKNRMNSDLELAYTFFEAASRRCVGKKFDGSKVEQDALAEANYYLGKYHITGVAPKPDRSRGIAYLEASAESGHRDANVLLGDLRWEEGFQGKVVTNEKSIAQSWKYYSEAQKLTNKTSLKKERKEKRSSNVEKEKQPDKGEGLPAHALFRLGYCAYYGAGECEKDFKTAREYFLAAAEELSQEQSNNEAESDHPEVYYWAGYCLAHEVGKHGIDAAGAHTHFNKVVESKSDDRPVWLAEAYYELGRLCVEQRGFDKVLRTEEDHREKAIEYFTRAGEAGMEDMDLFTMADTPEEAARIVTDSARENGYL